MMEPVYITGMGNVSPQLTYDNSRFLDEISGPVDSKLKARDPIYKDFIQGDMVRRMSRIIKMGVAAGKICLADAGLEMPDAIITGTGLGCIEDTEKFLSNMIRNHEEFLTPTSFIQSTHNTVGAQIALLLKCHNYNFTYVHRGISFESALTDAMIRISSGLSSKVLLGGLDELTPNSFTIMQRMGFWRESVAGEGAAFFCLSSQPGNKTYAKIRDVNTYFRPKADEAESHIQKFLSRNGLNVQDIGLVILGLSGDRKMDSYYPIHHGQLMENADLAIFKNLCGEYHTSSSFATWLGANILFRRQLPDAARYRGNFADTEHILIYNHFRNINHSLILLSRA